MPFFNRIGLYVQMELFGVGSVSSGWLFRIAPTSRITPRSFITLFDVSFIILFLVRLLMSCLAYLKLLLSYKRSSEGIVDCNMLAAEIVYD